jgi:hypothetical protein
MEANPDEELVEPILHAKYLTDLNPNRKAATKGGSMPGNFGLQIAECGLAERSAMGFK